MNDITMIIYLIGVSFLMLGGGLAVHRAYIIRKNEKIKEEVEREIEEECRLQDSVNEKNFRQYRILQNTMCSKCGSSLLVEKDEVNSCYCVRCSKCGHIYSIYQYHELI